MKKDEGGAAMAYYMCYYCGYLKVERGGELQSHQCPACGQPCAFVNVTSYRPEAGGEGNPDTRLMGLLLEGAEARRSARMAVAVSGTTSKADALCREAALIALQQLLEKRRPGYKAGERAPAPVAAVQAVEAGPEARKAGVTRVQVFARRVAPVPEAEEAGVKEEGEVKELST